MKTNREKSISENIWGKLHQWKHLGKTPLVKTNKENSISEHI